MQIEDVGALRILQVLHDAGYEGYLVGGAVRDALAGLPVADIDIATSARTETLLALFEGAKPIGGVCGTVCVPVANDRYEVTPYRQDGAYTDHRHPDAVLPADTLQEDLARRDFTINAMAWDGSRLIDPFGGQADLAAGVLRCVGEAERRFAEDALRILRLFRFAARLNFVPEPATRAAALGGAKSLATLPAERVRAELQALLLCKHPDAIIPLLETDALEPFGLPAPVSRFSLDQVPPCMLLRWWALCRLTGAGVLDVCQCLGFSSRFYRDLTRLNELSSAPPTTVFALKNLLRDGVPEEPGALLTAFAVTDARWQPAPALWQQLKTSAEPYNEAQLALSPGTMLALGIRGAEIGRVRRLLIDAVLRAPQLNQTATLIQLARELTRL